MRTAKQLLTTGYEDTTVIGRKTVDSKVWYIEAHFKLKLDGVEIDYVVWVDYVQKSFGTDVAAAATYYDGEVT